jgi:cell division septum initiation protein DivIVA
MPYQLFGGYSREETDRLLARAAEAYEDRISRLQAEVHKLEEALAKANERLARETDVEQQVGEVMVTAHRAVEAVKLEAKRHAEELLSGARFEARTILDEAERHARDLEASRALAETAIASAHEEARAIHDAIDTFRHQWWNLTTEALKQIEQHVPGTAPAGEGLALHDDLRDRLTAAHGESAD